MENGENTTHKQPELTNEHTSFREIMAQAMLHFEKSEEEQAKELEEQKRKVLAVLSRDTVLKLLTANNDGKEFLARATEINIGAWDDEDLIPKTILTSAGAERRTPIGQPKVSGSWDTIMVPVIATNRWSLNAPFKVRFPNGDEAWVRNER